MGQRHHPVGRLSAAVKVDVEQLELSLVCVCDAGWGVGFKRGCVEMGGCCDFVENPFVFVLMSRKKKRKSLF